MSHASVVRGVRALLHAVYQVEEPPEHDLDEGLEVAHMSRARWEDCIEQLGECRRLTRRQLGLRDDGSDGYDELPDGSPARTLATGFRTFLRRMTVLLPGPATIESLAAELHAIVYGDEAEFSPVTWRDYVTVLEGASDQPSVWLLRGAAELLRQGHDRDTVARATALSHDQVVRLGVFLGLREWRQESKRRAAEIALRHGWSARQFADDYNERYVGLDSISPRRAAEYLAEVRETVAA